VWSLFGAVASNAGIQLCCPAFIFKNRVGNCRQHVKHILVTWQVLHKSTNLAEESVVLNPTVPVVSSYTLTDINMKLLQNAQHMLQNQIKRFMKHHLQRMWWFLDKTLGSDSESSEFDSQSDLCADLSAH
jgi:hypothetical protein